ncbi:MAG TPA: hypothetical protein DEA96_07880 [Leptospiraceae bacterium]|nr:hypothetical protein [Spirochaetaceae bacterium]HBS04866.1 hypothetical protein [Leptospiraceae bacterium]|tara:strand:+ start:8206 stop:8994 length:789 start_codon:yes stop_codon:yes gene_type:complete
MAFRTYMQGLQRSFLIPFFILGLIMSSCVVDPYNPADPGSEAFVEYNLLRCLVSDDCPGSGTAPLQIVFQEDWEAGIDAGKWKTWGSPVPTFEAGLGYGGSDTVNPNGDASYESGFTSYQNFDITKPTTIEFRAFTYSNATDWETLWVGFGQDTAAGYTGIAAQPAASPAIRLWPETVKLDIRFGLGWNGNIQRPWLGAYDNTWIHFKMEIHEDRTMSFYQDGVLIGTTTATVPDTLTNQPVSIHGRSYNNVLYVDDIIVKQ